MGQTPPLSIQNGPSKGFLEAPQDHSSWGYLPPCFLGGMEGGLRVKGVPHGGRGEIPSPHGFSLSISKEKPIQPQIGPGSAFILPRGGSDPPCRWYQRGEGRGFPSLHLCGLLGREEDPSFTQGYPKKCPWVLRYGWASSWYWRE
jgi:hypothetical protein